MNLQPETFLTEFIRYNNWANAEIIALLKRLTPEQLAAGAPGTYGSIHATLGHLVSAEADYIQRITGSAPVPSFRWQDGPSIDAIAEFAALLAPAWLEIIQSVPQEQMVHEEEDGYFMDYQARLLFMQAVNHGIEHRVNITTILAGLGIPTPELDVWGYLATHGADFKLKEGKL